MHRLPGLRQVGRGPAARAAEDDADIVPGAVPLLRERHRAEDRRT
jgi:hypothetical protein